MADLEERLAAAEHDIARTVADVLREVATEFGQELSVADEIVAARFSVSRIARMFTDRMPRIVRRLLRISEEAATVSAEAVDATLPAGWDDLPGRYDDDTLPEPFRAYVETTEHLLRAVGDRLADVATAELSEGVAAGETIDQLRARLRTAFDREGAQLGDTREERIARTEAGRAWNTATLATARAVTGPDRPIVKQWITRRDNRVRESHEDVNGQIRLVDEPFTVAGIDMDCPHDPAAPASEVVNCRCVLALYPEIRSAAFDSQEAPPPRVFESQEPPVTTATSPALQAAADGSHLSGAMIALMPTEEDAQRLALDDGEDAAALHLTLFFLGQGDDWSDESRADLIEQIRYVAADLGGPAHANAFGAAHWNADSDEPSWVWSVGDDRDRPGGAPTLGEARAGAGVAVEDARGPEIPVQHSPWQPHVCAAYSDDLGLLAALVDRLGPITFDRIRVAFAGDHTDIPLATEEEAPMGDEESTAAAMATRTWSTPDDTALAFENQETGDGRIFAAGALYWETGPFPLQYADEMLMGHEGAELAGAIDTVGRDGDRITGSGVLYANRPAGADACTLLDEGAPLGVSVDLDSVDVEFVDRTISEDEEGFLIYASAHLPQASLLRLEDGAWMLTARSMADWTAAGIALSRSASAVQLITGPGGTVSRAAVQQAFAGTGVLTAAAGDADDPDGVVVHAEQAGDFLLRITRARMRGATLVAMPAYDRARIVLDPIGDEEEETAAAVVAAASDDPHERVITYVASSPLPVSPREVAAALDMRMDVAHRHLVRAAQSGRLVRLGRGQYVGASTIPEGPTVIAAGHEDLTELEASAWTAMRDTAPMPAAWFREPTPEELPPGSGGVHYRNGRIFGWVAQAGEPHAGHPGKKITIDGLGKLDLTHFLRARFKLDDGQTVRAGAFTMNVGHHRDGAECESAACQFDDTRTVAGIVTVGMSKGGLWFSGAAAPWLSEWDRQVFAACQPSYHMVKGRKGWQLRAVLSVPVPGHSSPLVATAIAERANLALTAAAAGLLTSGDTVSGHPDAVSVHDADTLSPSVDEPVDHAAVAALLADPGLLDALTAALARRDDERRAEAASLAASIAPQPTASQGAH
ncbi:phage minor head protein [Actinacidiphila glaucinigra]|uniref:phage minor head protein n=1 Tax=Actinacidiphila glaucinigra TaxID=235986 RepID=UPI00378FBF23